MAKAPFTLAYDERYTQFDYTGRTDDNPIYIGYSAQGAADGDSAWIIKKLTYDGSNRCTKIEIVYKKDWTLRANYF